MRTIMGFIPANFAAASLVPLFFVATVSLAQSQSANPASGSSSGAPPSTPVSAATGEELLSKTAKLYYSASSAGLESFTCLVHPEWREFLLTADKSATIAENDPRITQLSGARISLQADLSGNANVQWSAPSSLESAKLYANLKTATSQTLEGFIQFWAPFMNGSMIPDSASGVEIQPANGGYIIRSVHGQTATGEFIDTNLILHQFDLGLGDMTLRFLPVYKTTPQGLLVASFVSHILPSAASNRQPQEMHVDLQYQTVNGFPIPANVAIEVVGTGKFHFAFDGCSVQRAAH